MNSRRVRQICGFTLIEMTMAIVITSIIMLGSFSVVLLAFRALPDSSTGPGATAAASAAMEQINFDLNYATSMITATANDIEFLVQDRDGNGVADKIRYAWSGTAGAPLLRYYSPGDPTSGTYTYGPAMTVLPNTQEFALVYDKRSKTYSVSGGESAEMLLYSCDSARNLADSTVTGTSYIGQYFIPQLPPSATGWKVTRVKFKARSNGFINGSITCQLRSASAGLPTGTVLDSQTLSEGRLTTFYTWHQIGFSGASGLSPSAGLCLLLMLNANSPAGDIQYQSSGAAANGSNLLLSSGSSSAWTASPTQRTNLQVYGTVNTASATVTQYNLTGVRVTLRSGVGTNSRVRTTVRIPNEPQVSG